MLAALRLPLTLSAFPKKTRQTGDQVVSFLVHLCDVAAARKHKTGIITPTLAQFSLQNCTVDEVSFFPSRPRCPLTHNLSLQHTRCIQGPLKSWIHTQREQRTFFALQTPVLQLSHGPGQNFFSQRCARTIV